MFTYMLSKRCLSHNNPQTRFEITLQKKKTDMHRVISVQFLYILKNWQYYSLAGIRRNGPSAPEKHQYIFYLYNAVLKTKLSITDKCEKFKDAY